MRLMRLGPRGLERPVVQVDDEHYVEVGDIVGDYDAAFFAAFDTALPRLAGAVADAKASGTLARFAGERVGAPFVRPHQILCVGLNYRDHAAESGLPVPDEPILFSKSPNTLVGPDDDVVMPPDATKLDWEVELGIVIGRPAYALDAPEEAAAAIAGYVLVNDVSERAFQLDRGGQWLKGKSAPTFNPAGPWLVTADEIDPSAVSLTLSVNDVDRQNGTTATMIFPPTEVVRYISRFLRLEPGDLINTGTPPGVGMGATPPEYLRVGDLMTVSGAGLGTQRQRVVEYRA